MGTIRNFKFKVVKNFLDKQELEIANTYGLLKHKNNIQFFDTHQNNNGDSSFYNDTLSETFLLKKLDLMEKCICVKNWTEGLMKNTDFKWCLLYSCL